VVEAKGLICCDLDGTLLLPDKTMGKASRQALEDAVAAGLVCAISSGRHPFNVFELMDGLGLPRTCVCLSGAATFVDGALIRIIPLGLPAVRSAIAVAAGEGAYVSVGGADFNAVCGQISRGKESAASAFSRYLVVESYEELEEYASKREGKLLKLAMHAKDQAQYERLRESLSRVDGVRCARSDVNWLDVTAVSCSKAAGIRALADYLGIPVSRVAVLGDDENDIEAIAEAGIGIAMGNAIPEAKAVASLVVGDNAHDGAAEGIRAAVAQLR
jgi:Cof subfamily protein (haloacid dehalogenase superfamily)